MRIPQTAERLKEAPAQALRAVFAGVGQVLLITEKVRRRGGGESQDVEVAPETAGDSGAAETSGTAKAGTAKAGTAKAGTAKAGTAKAATVKAGTEGTGTAKASTTKASTSKASAVKPAKTPETEAAGSDAPAAAESTSALPLPHYSELSIASLRARLRGLDIAQVRELIAYERTHEDRENVIAMFERRIAKLEEAASPDTTQG